MFVVLTVEMDWTILLGGCLVKERENRDVLVVLCSFVLYEYVSG